MVVEAASRSGALITADFALEHGKEVFAVPGRADLEISKGSNALIQNGAKLVMSVEDIFDELDLEAEPRRKCVPANEDDVPGEDTVLSPEEHEVFKGIMEKNNIHVAQITEESGIDPRTLAEILLKLELKGLISPQAGKKYTLKQ